MCDRICEYFLDTDTTLKVFCDTRDLPEGLSYERFYRISNGTTIVTLTDVMFWSNVIPDFTTTLSARLAAVVHAMPQLAPPA